MGYAVVSAPKNGPSLLAITEHGNYDELSMGERPWVDAYIQKAKDYAQNLLAEMMANEIPQSRGLGFEIDTTNRFDPNPDPNKTPWETKEEEESATLSTIGPRVSVNWRQKEGFFYGKQNPNKLAGCATLAIAQAMTYFRYPAYMNLTYGGRNQRFNIDWTKINLHNWERSCNCGAEKQAIHDTISTIIAQISHDTQADHSNPGYTNYTASKVRNGILKYGLSATAFKYYTAESSSEISSSNGIILIMGFNGNLSADDPKYGKDGHYWLIDGLKKEQVTHTCYYRRNSSDTWKIMSQQQYIVHYDHYNWGQGPQDNGWYRNLTFTPRGSTANYEKDAMYLVMSKK